MNKLLLLGLVAMLATACTGRQAIETTNAVKGLSKDQIITQMYNCGLDILDPHHRGSGCQ